MNARTLLLYLYFEECNQNADEVFNMITTKKKAKLSYEEIDKIYAEHPEWEEDYMTIVDKDFPGYLKRDSDFVLHNLVFKREILNERKSY